MAGWVKGSLEECVPCLAVLAEWEGGWTQTIQEFPPVARRE